MSEVGGIQASAARVVVPTSSKGSSASAGKAVESGNTLPPATEAMKGGAKSTIDTAVQLDQAVAQMNEYIQAETRDLHFSVDQSSGQTVVRVVDRESGDLIRQIPNEVFLSMAERARKNEAIHLISANG